MAFIFVIDDEPLLLNLVSTVLRSDGHEVNAITDPLEACAAVSLVAIPVDLLITDADMHPISGFQLVERLRGNRIDCPVIFMSGHHGLTAIVTDSPGQQSVLEKPFTAAELRSAVQKALTASTQEPWHAA